MSDYLEMEPAFDAQAKIKVIGVGGAGGNAVNRMIDEGIMGVEFLSINTDAASLDNNRATKRIQIGTKLTKGLGAGANPEIGRAAIEENRDEIAKELEGIDMVFITAGMGGGTGTGAAPVVAEVAKEKGVLTVAIVTKPFLFEGKVRERNALYGINELRKHVDSIIVIQNQKLLTLGSKSLSLMDSFKTADSVLNDATRGLSNLITAHGIINVDFADMKTVIIDSGDALIGMGESDASENRAIIAAEAAINSPLLEDIDISGATGLLVNFTGGNDLTLDEVNQAHERINEAIGEFSDTNIIFGAIIDPEMTGKVQVTVVATGFKKNIETKVPPVMIKTNRMKQMSMPLPETSSVASVLETTESTAIEDLPVIDVPAIPTQTPKMEATPTEVVRPGVPNPLGGNSNYTYPMPGSPDWYDIPAAERKRLNVVSKDHSTDRYYAPRAGSGMTEHMDGEREIPAFLRQQMQ